MTLKQIRFAWKYRRPLWKYRKLIARRKQIAAIASVAGAAILATALLRRAHCEQSPTHA